MLVFQILPRTCLERLVLTAMVAASVHAPSAHAQTRLTDSVAPAPAAHISIEPDLDAGVHLLYELKFSQARERFVGWQQQHPSEPLGPALEAAADLFEQFYRKGVLTSDFFLDDKRLLGGIQDQPDSELEPAFIAAAQRSESLARERLAAHPRDPDALLALALADGMRSNNASLIEKRHFEALRFLTASGRDARILLEVAPGATDAYFVLGAANYIIGCLPGYQRFFLRLGGVHGDKALGMKQLSDAASTGHYLRPYAMLFLALAALREHNAELARAELSQLTREFPENSLFAHELTKVTPVVVAAPSPKR
jgi:hypothetical protein